MIKTVSLCKTFHAGRQSVRALKNISLSVERGEVVCVIGPSGAGKTTLLRAVKNLLPVDEGKIYIDDKLLFDCRNGVNAVKTRRKERNKILLEIGMVFQNFNLFPHKTVLENLTLAPIHVRKLPPAQARAKSLQFLERVGLGDKKDAYPSQLSGGQKQRAAIARALVMEPEIMLFDEPTSSLDPELAGEVLAVIKQLAAAGMTMLVVSHEMGFVRDVADRVAFMCEGSILETASPEQLFTSPAHDRTRQFLNIN
ncbi:MAG: amino acid ABC transporter ATP-binding protein [Treponema sp.]|nr:amino acid ABC transporter ATP-binding protein [Treponema sp.]